MPLEVITRKHLTELIEQPSLIAYNNKPLVFYCHKQFSFSVDALCMLHKNLYSVSGLYDNNGIFDKNLICVFSLTSASVAERITLLRRLFSLNRYISEPSTFKLRYNRLTTKQIFIPGFSRSSYVKYKDGIMYTRVHALYFKDTQVLMGCEYKFRQKDDFNIDYYIVELNGFSVEKINTEKDIPSILECFFDDISVLEILN